MTDDDGYPGDGYPGDGYSGDGYPGDGYSGDGYPGGGYPGDGYPGGGYPGGGYPSTAKEPHPSRIIAGVSGTPRGLPALRWAADLARVYQAELIPVHAWFPPFAAWSGYQFPSEELCREWEQAARQRLGDSLELAFGRHPPGLRLRPVIAEGAAGNILVRTACRAGDVLVIGTGRRAAPRAVSRLWRGGVSRYCLARARCPVIAIPPPALEQAARQLTAWPGAAAFPS